MNETARLAQRIRAAFARQTAEQPHFRGPQPGGILSCAVPMSTAYTMARDILAGEAEGLEMRIEDEDHAWDGDCPAPAYHVWAAVYAADDTRMRHPLASLGGIGVDSLTDPYLEYEIRAELYREALDALASERDRIASIAAAEMSERATYAGVQR